MPINRQQKLGREEAARRYDALEQAELGMWDLVDEVDGIELLVGRDPGLRRGESPGVVRKKVKQRIRVALGNGELELVDGCFVLGRLINWARTKRAWAPHLADLPAVNVAHGAVQLPQLQAAGIAYALPATLDECHAALHAAHARIEELQRQGGAAAA